MGKQTNQYTKTRTAASSQAQDRIDWDSTEDGGTNFESAQMTRDELILLISNNVDTLYTNSGSLSGTTIVDGLTIYDLEFNNINSFEINADATSITAINTMSFGSGADISFLPTDTVTIGTLAISPTGAIDLSVENGINTEGSYYVDNLQTLSRQSMGDNGIALGKDSFQNATVGTRNTGLGDKTGSAVTNGVRNLFAGNNAGILCNDSYSTFLGFNAGSLLAGTNSGNIIAGANSGANITGGNNLLILGRDAGAVSPGSYSSSIAIGRAALIDASNQFVMGSNNEYIEEMWFGGGISDSNIPFTELEMRVTNIVAGTTDKAAGLDWIWNGSQGTGTGVGGDHIWKVAPDGTTGSAVNALVEVLRIKGDGNINMANLPTSSAGLASGDIWSNSGVLTVV